MYSFELYSANNIKTVPFYLDQWLSWGLYFLNIYIVDSSFFLVGEGANSKKKKNQTISNKRKKIAHLPKIQIIRGVFRKKRPLWEIIFIFYGNRVDVSFRDFRQVLDWRLFLVDGD